MHGSDVCDVVELCNIAVEAICSVNMCSKPLFVNVLPLEVMATEGEGSDLEFVVEP